MMAAETPLGFDPLTPPPPPPPPHPKDELESLPLDDDGGSFSPRLLTAVPASVDGGDPLLHPPRSPSSSSTAAAASAILAPFHPPLNGVAAPAPLPGRTAPDFATITVSDPQKEIDPAASKVSGSSTFVSYLITTRAIAGGGEFRVRRRFRDVVALADQLAEAYRGFFIPARPDKSVVEGQVMQRQEFVEQRRTALERYLQRLAAHPVAGRSEELHAFLGAPGGQSPPVKMAVVMALASSQVMLAKGSRDFLGIFKDLTQTVANGWAATRPPAVQDDKELAAMKAKMRELEQQLSTSSQHAEALVKAQQDVAETMGELGMVFIKLGKFETEEATHSSQRVRATEIKRFATNAVKASRLHRGLNAQTVKHLDILHEYMGLMLSVHSAFADRSSTLYSIQSLSADLASLHAQLGRLETSRSRKAEELKEVIRITEDAKNCAIRDYEQIKENNRTETERLEKERRHDFLQMVKGFVVSQGLRKIDSIQVRGAVGEG